MTIRTKIACRLISVLVSFTCLFFQPTTLSAQYCASNATSTADSDIDEVIIYGVNTLANNTAGQCANYSDFTNMVVNMTIGSTYSADITLGTCGGNYTKHAKVYIDYNQDFDFDDPGEEVAGLGPIVAPALTNVSFTVPITALPGSTRVRVVGEETGTLGGVLPCGTFTWGETEDYTVVFGAASPNDMAIGGLLSPGAGCQLGNEPITVELVNYGTDTAVAFDISYILTDPVFGTLPAMVESYQGAPIPSLGSVSHTFIDPYNFTNTGTYTLTVFVQYNLDGNPVNDTAVFTLDHLGVGWSEDFELFTSSTNGTGIVNGWTNSPTNSSTVFRWQPNQGTTTSSTTGPDNDHTTGSGMYMYTEASSGGAGAVAEFISPCIDLANASCPTAEFWYHMFGATMGELHLDIDAGAGWVLDIMPPLIGQQQTSSAAAWEKKQVNLLSYAGSGVQFRFRAIRGNDFYGDMAIDDFLIFNSTQDDVAVLSVDNPAEGCGLSSATTVSVTLMNNSCSPVSGFPLELNVVGPIGSGPIIENFSGSIPGGGSASYTFSSTVDMSLGGQYTMEVISDLPMDADSQNDTLIHVLNNSGSGLVEDFETFVVGAPGSVANGWETVASNSFNWYVEDSEGINENSTGTGPLYDHTTPAVDGGIYMYVEASGITPGDSAMLISPCINLSGIACPALEFWYHMFGINMGELHVDIDAGSGWINDAAPPIIGLQQTVQSDPYERYLFGLNQYAGSSIRVRLRALCGPSYESDISIDDFRIFDNPTDDIAVLSVDAPVDGCGYSPLTPVTVTLSNLGCTDQTGFPVFVEVAGPVSSGPFSENVGITVPAGSSVSYTLTTPMDMSLPGEYDVQVYAMHPSDAANENDTAFATVSHSFEDLELLSFAPSGVLCGLSTTEFLTVTIVNHGCYDASGFPIDIQANGPIVTGPITEVISATVPSGDTVTVALSTPLDLSALGSYTLVIDNLFALDNDPANNQLLGNIDNQTAVLAPFFEDFESFTVSTTGAGMANGWMNDPNGNGGLYRWQPDDGTTSSTGTGPIGDHTTGTGVYLYTEATSGSVGDSTFLNSPCIDLGPLACPKLGFWYHMFGPGMGELHVDVISNGVLTYDIINPLIGQQQTASADPYLYVEASLSAFVGQTVKIRFRGVRGTSFESDMAIDDVEVFEGAGDDVAVTSISLSGGAGPCTSLGASELISVDVANAGCQIAGSIDLTLTVMGPINSGPITETYVANLLVGTSGTYTFSTPVDFSSGGTYSIEVVSTYSGDANLTNNTAVLEVQNIGDGYTQDYESFVVGSPGTFVDGWTTSATGGSFIWTVEDANGANENSTGTGPFYDHTFPAAAGGIYIYTEATGGATGDEAYLVSPCLNLGTMDCPKIDFWYHMFGTDMGSLHVDLFDGVSWINDVIPPLTGQQQSTQSNPYQLQTIDLGGYGGQSIQFRFRGVRGTGYMSDMAIDDIYLYDVNENDIEVLGLIHPEEGCNYSNTTEVCVAIVNHSCIEMSGFEMAMEISGPINTSLVSETVINSIFPGDTLIYTFTNTADMSLPGSYTITSYSSLVGDIELGNDTLIAEVYHNENDVEVFALSFSESACGLGSNEIVSVFLINHSCSDITSIPLQLGAVGPVNSGPFFETINVNLPAGDTTLVTLTSLFDFSVLGTYNVGIVSQLPGDANPLNDSLNSFIEHLMPFLSPYQEDFESFVPSGNGTGFLNGWSASPENTNSDFRWQPNSGNTTTFNTGPSGDHTTGSGVYLYCEASGGSAGETASAISPCIDLSTIQCPKLSFWYHMFGSDVTSLHLDVQNNGVWTNDVMVPLTGQIQGASTDAYLQKQLSLSPFAGEVVRFRFRVTRAAGVKSDIAIDDFSVFNDPIQDLEIVSFSTNTDSCNLSASESVTVIIANNGCNDETGFNVSLSATGPISSGPYVENVPLTVIAGDTIQYTFSGTLDLANSGNYELKCVAQLPGDNDPTNDTLQSILNSLDAIFVNPGSDVTICDGESYQLGATPSVFGGTGSFEFNWIPEDILDVPTSQNPFASPTDTTVFYLEAVDNNGCTVTDSVLVNVNPLFPVDLGSDTTICQGDIVPLDAGPGYASYFWSTNGVSQVVNVSTADEYSVAALQTNGCTVYDTLNIAVNTPFSINLGNDTTICEGESITLDPDYSGATYNWSSGETTALLTVDSASTYSVTVTLGCVASDNFNLSISPLPVVDLGPNITLCQGDSVDLNAQNPGQDYMWSTTASSQVINVNTSGVYNVTVSDAFGCEESDNIIVIFTPLPSDPIGSDTTICDTSASLLLNAAYPGASYLWSTNAVTPSVLINTSQVVDVIVNVQSCQVFDTMEVNFFAPPELDLGSDTALCLGDSVTLDAQNPGQQYMWSNSASSQMITVLYNGYYTATVTDQNGCTATDGVDVDFFGYPNVEFGPDTTMCADDSLILNAFFPNSTYDWNTSDTVSQVIVTSPGVFSVVVSNEYGCSTMEMIEVDFHAPVPLQFGEDTILCDGEELLLYAGVTSGVFNWSTGEDQPSILVDTAGTYYIDLIDSVGCYATDTLIVSYTPTPIVDLGPTTLYCGESTIDLDAGNPGADFSWSTGESSQVLTVDTSGSYTVTVTNEFECISIDNVILTLSDYPVVELGPDTVTCGENVVVNAGNSGALYEWSTGQVDQIIIVNNPGTYSVTVTNLGGCSTVDEMMVEVLEPTFVNMSYVSSSCPTISFSASATGAPPTGWFWDFGDGNTSTSQNPSHTYTAGATQTVSVTAFAQCGNAGDQEVIALACLTGMDDDLNGHIRLFPNPNNGLFEIDFEDIHSNSFKIELLDARGKLVWKKEYGGITASHTLEVDAGELSEGMYLVKMTLDDQELIQKVIIK